MQRQKETDARRKPKVSRRKPKASRHNPSGRNRTSDQLISENTETQYSTLHSIALRTELHSVTSLLPQQSHKTTDTSFGTHTHSFCVTTAHHISHVALYYYLHVSLLFGCLVQTRFLHGLFTACRRCSAFDEGPAHPRGTDPTLRCDIKPSDWLERLNASMSGKCN